jgi:hypothetical protein
MLRLLDMIINYLNSLILVLDFGWEHFNFFHADTFPEESLLVFNLSEIRWRLDNHALMLPRSPFDFWRERFKGVLRDENIFIVYRSNISFVFLFIFVRVIDNLKWFDKLLETFNVSKML